MNLLSDIGPSELSTVLVVLMVVALPVAAIAFSRSGRGLEELGKGTFAIDKEEPRKSAGAPPAPDPAEREMEVRQMVEAAAWRQLQRGEDALDTDAEIKRLLGGGDAGSEADPGPAGLDPEAEQIRDEIRQLVRSNNDRRERRGEPPLDVESEVDRRLREWS